MVAKSSSQRVRSVRSEDQGEQTHDDEKADQEQDPDDAAEEFQDPTHTAGSKELRPSRAPT
jgi:hypothetical protein